MPCPASTGLCEGIESSGSCMAGPGFYSVGNFAASLQDQLRPSCASWKGLVLGMGFLLSHLLLGTGDCDH